MSYPVLGALGNDRFLLGWTEMIPVEYLLTDFTGNAPRGESNRNWDPDQEYPFMFYMRVPQAFWVAEISATGEFQTAPQKLSGVGWGEFNNMASMGDGKLVWTYIPNPARNRVRPSQASANTWVVDQKTNAPPCAQEKGTGSEPTTFLTAVYSQATSTSMQGSQCETPSDGQPVCSRLSPPLRNSTYGCGGPGGWETATGRCSEESLGRLKGGASDDGSRGLCGFPPGGSASYAPRSSLNRLLHYTMFIGSMLLASE